MSTDQEVRDQSSTAEKKGPSREQQRLARPKRRTDVTASELESRFKGWRIERRERIEARTPEENAQRARRILAGAMSVAIVALVATFALGGQHYETTSAANEERITELQGQLADAETPRDDAAQQQVLTELSEQVSTKAEEVATAQQSFAALHHEATTSTSPGDGSPSQEMLAVAEHRRNLEPYFDDNSLVLPHEEAYQWSTAVSHEPDRIDPRFAWYVRHDGSQASEADASTWQVESAMPVAGEQAVAHAVWSCTDTDTGEVLAWASADFSGETGTFSDLKVGVTVLGEQHSSSSAAPPAEEIPELEGGS